MDAQQGRQSHWMQGYLLGASVLILLIAVLNFLLFRHQLSGSLMGIPLEAAAMIGGIALALPIGLVNIWLAFSGLHKGLPRSTQTIALAGLIGGALGLVTALFWYGPLVYLLAGGFR
jgi:hypothetical protein